MVTVVNPTNPTMHIVKRTPVRTCALYAASAFCLMGSVNLWAQTAPKSDTKATDSDEALVLSPFVVEATEDQGYQAKDTLAGTRVRTELRDVGSAIQAITSKFLQDTGAKNSQDLLVYTTNTEVGGSSGNFTGVGNGAQIDTRSARTSPQTNTRVRGLASADNTRDFFLTDIPWDSYNVGRVDLQRGPNAILFGIGSPAGIVNSAITGASFKDSNKVEYRVDNNGSNRVSADFNKVILKGELAVRVSLLDDLTKYQQKPAYNHDKRIYGAAVYRPDFLKKNGRETTFRMNYESGHVNANRVRVIPPVDAVTPWFNNLGKNTYNDTHIADTSAATQAIDPTAGALNKYYSDNVTLNPTYSAYLGAYGGQIFDQPTVIFADPNSGVVQGYFAPSLNNTGRFPKPSNFNGGPWSVYKGISSFSDYAQNAQLPNYLLGAYKSKTVADTGIFDYNKQLIDGPNKYEKQKFHAANFTAEQTFFNNALGFEAAYDRQDYADEDGSNIGTPYLTIEVANTLPDGRANPNVGRAMSISSPYSNGGQNKIRESFRYTGFAEVDFKKFLDNKNLASILGVHKFTGLYSTQQTDTQGRGWYSYATEVNSYRPWQDVSLDSRRIPGVTYLSGNLSGLTAANQAHIGNVKAEQTPYSGNLIYKYNPEYKPSVLATATSINPTTGVPTFPGATSTADLIGWQPGQFFRVLDGYHGQDRNALTTASSVRHVRERIKSEAFIWQGFFWDGTIVPTVGWRKDTDVNRNAGNASENKGPGYPNGDGSWNSNDKTWVLPTSLTDPRVGNNNVSYGVETGESLSWSVVVHTPKELRKKMPLETDISLFYNKSENFQPAGGRRGVFGDELTSPTGKTKDYGITITTFHDKLTLKINRFETSIKNSSLDGGGTGALSSVYRVSSNEAWGYMFAKWNQLNIPGVAGNENNYARVIPTDPSSALIDPNVTLLKYQPAPGQSVADALAGQNLAINTFIDPANKPPQKFLTYWGINRDTWDPTGGWNSGGVNFTVPGSLAVTGDTVSKGTEIELTAQPVPGWNITLNYSKTHAQRVNLAGSFAGWVDNRNTFYQGPAGDVRLWNGGYGGQTVKSVWNSEFYASYLLYRLQENADVPELRPTRINLITNYDFQNGSLKGLNVGGGYRWQDGIVVGYPITAGAQPFFDLTKPWMGPKEQTFDFWTGYEKKLSNRINWRIQLNVRNVFASKKLIPVTVQPDGSPGTSRIAEPRVVSLTNTFTF